MKQKRRKLKHTEGGYTRRQRFLEYLLIYKKIAEFSYDSHPDSPIINILYWHGTFRKINELILIHY